MHIRMFVAAFLFIMFLGSQIVLLPSQAFAAFCGCGNCWMMYVYPGYCTCGPPYPYCLAEDYHGLQFRASTDNSPADTSSIPESLTSAMAKADGAGGVMDLMSGGECLRNKVTLSLLGDARGDLKFVPVRFDSRIL